MPNWPKHQQPRNAVSHLLRRPHHLERGVAVLACPHGIVHVTLRRRVADGAVSDPVTRIHARLGDHPSTPVPSTDVFSTKMFVYDVGGTCSSVNVISWSCSPVRV